MALTRFPIETTDARIEVTLPVGIHVLELVVEDSAGLRSAPDQVVIEVRKEAVLPTITGIQPVTGIQGANIEAVISGTLLTGATAVTFEGSGVTATILGGSATTLPIRISIAAGAAVGQRGFTVTTPAGVVRSPGNVAFSIAETPRPRPILPQPMPITPRPQPIIEPTPIVLEPRPVIEPTPIVVEPRPVIEPRPIVVEPRPVIEPTPIVVEPRPVIEPRPIVVEPRPVIEPTPIVVEPRPVIEPRAIVVDPQPIVVGPGPLTVEPRPVTPQPRAIVVDPGPITPEIRAITAEPRGIPVEPILTPIRGPVLPGKAAPSTKKPSGSKTVKKSTPAKKGKK